MKKNIIACFVAAGLLGPAPAAHAQSSRLVGTWQLPTCERGGEGVSWMRPTLIIGTKTIGQYVRFYSDNNCTTPETTYISREGTYIVDKQSDKGDEFELAIFYGSVRYIVRAKLRIDEKGLHLCEQHRDGKEVWVTYSEKAPATQPLD